MAIYSAAITASIYLIAALLAYNAYNNFNSLYKSA